MILIEVTAAVDAAGTLETFYLSDESFVTSPTDTPLNTAFLPVLIDPGGIGIHTFSDGRTGGSTKLETGEIVIANVDGAFDAWAEYSFDGRDITIRSGISGAYPAGFTKVLSATVESIEASWDKIVIRLRDKQWLFQLPVLQTRYAGTNSLPNGLEGTASDIKGKLKPKAYGKVFNVSPPLVNSSRLIYEVGVCNSVDAVYDQGLALTVGAVYTSQTDMETTAPAAGAFRAWPAGGYFRLGSTPAGQITADVTQGATAADRTVAQILEQLGLDSGLTGGEISSADVSALDTLNSNVVGIWLDDDAPFQRAMDEIAESIGAFYGFDSAGVLRMGQLTAPSGSPLLSLYDYDIAENIERRPPRDNGVPTWRVVVQHTKIFTVQTSDLAGAVTAATRAYLAEEYRAEIDFDSAVKTQWKLAQEMLIASLLTVAANAASEATRRLNLYKVPRDIFDVQIDLGVFTDAGLKLLDLVEVTLDRFSMGSGRSFRLLGFRTSLTANTVTLTLWG